MRAPIIISEHGDLVVFEAKEDAEMYLEAIDVANGEYVGYDSEGRLLRLTPAWPHSATITDGESEPSHKDELSAALSGFFLQLGLPADWVRQASLEEMIDKAREYRANR